MATTQERVELFLRFTRWNRIALLVLVVVLGGTALSLILSPAGSVSGKATVWLIPISIAVVLAFAVALRSRRWAQDSPEVRVVMQDELRRTNMNRALRASLIVVLATQWPLGLGIGFLTNLEPPRAAMGMAAATITLGLATLIALLLIFDRE